MNFLLRIRNFQAPILLMIILGLAGCTSTRIRPLTSLNASLFQQSNSYREPTLANRWLATLTSIKGKEKIELIDIRRRRRVALPQINITDSQPISVSISSDGQRIAFIRQRNGQTELFIYLRLLGTLRKIELTPQGVPRRVSLDASGRLLAVQVSRGGRWDVDVIRL